MWFPFQLSKKGNTEGPHYAGYNERAIATTVDVAAFLFFMIRPIYWVQGWVQANYAPHVDVSVLERTQELMLQQDFGWITQIKLAAVAMAESGAWKVPLVTNSVSTLMVLAVYIGCVLIFKTTPGKWLMGVKITRSDNETFPPAWQVILRSVAAIFSCIPLMLGFIWMSFDKKSRTWHDMIAGTRVITTRPDGWYWQQIKEGFRWLREQVQGPQPPEEPPTTPPKN